MTERKRRVLIVDDDPSVRDVHRQLVESLGYEAETADDGIEALAKLVLGIDLVLLDGQMPSMDGFEVARRIRAMPEHRFLPIIMVSGLSGDVEHRRALDVGVNDFISKPVDRDLLNLRSRWLMELKEAHDRLDDRRVDLERSVEERTQALRRALEELTESERRIQRAHLDTIRRLTVAAELKDSGTGEHIEQIGLYAEVVAREMGLSPGEVETIRHAAPLHDVGKLGIPDRVLLKPGRLDEEEWAVMKAHAVIGADLLAGSESGVIQMGERIARAHHERWDGAGYPEGLEAEEIPLEARICAVVDVFDALTRRRPYRGPLPPERVVEMMRAEEGAHFDPEVLRAFLDGLWAARETLPGGAKPVEEDSEAERGEAV